MRFLLPRSAFGRNVVTLATGTAISLAIPVIASPVLTRLFDPMAFGALALYLAFSTIGTVVITGRYELAILIPREDAEARDLLVAAIGLALLGTVLAAAALLAYSFLPLLPQTDTLPGWAYMVPAGMGLAAIVQAIGYWLNRRTAYRDLVNSRIAQSAASIGSQTTAGLAGGPSVSLIGGHLFGQAIALASLMRTIRRTEEGLLRGVTWPSVRMVARAHRRFPLFIAPGHLANATSLQLPTIMLASFFGPAVAGLYALAERVLVLPSALLGNSIGEVYRQEAAETYKRLGNCRELYLRTLRRLAMVGFLPCAVIAAGGPWIFALTFGAEWREAGAMASILAVMVFFQILSSPLSQTVLLADLHRLELVWQFARVAVAAGAIWAGQAWYGSPRASVALFAAGFAVLHLMHSAMQYHAASGKARLRA